MINNYLVDEHMVPEVMSEVVRVCVHTNNIPAWLKQAEQITASLLSPPDISSGLYFAQI